MKKHIALITALALIGGTLGSSPLLTKAETGVSDVLSDAELTSYDIGYDDSVSSDRDKRFVYEIHDGYAVIREMIERIRRARQVEPLGTQRTVRCIRPDPQTEKHLLRLMDFNSYIRHFIAPDFAVVAVYDHADVLLRHHPTDLLAVKQMEKLIGTALNDRQHFAVNAKFSDFRKVRRQPLLRKTPSWYFTYA